jgi:CheY-like chemotaxis protein
MPSPDGPILVVDDDADSRRFLATLLRAMGYPVTTATNGKDALTVAKQQNPCLILLDLMMPVMDGFEFRAAQMQSPDLAETPVIVVSAIGNENQVVRRLGRVPAVPKPIDVGVLLAKVSTYCAPPRA